LRRKLFLAAAVAFALCAVLVSWKSVANPGATATPGAGPEVSPELLRRHVVALSSAVAPRYEGDPKALAAAAEYVRATWASFGVVAEAQPYSVGDRSFTNLVASFGPRDGERIVIGAHYDVCGALPGADDNASGVAGLIELARLLQARKTLPRRIDLVAWSTEEPPYFGSEDMGSWHHERALSDAGAQVALVLSLEMIGYFTDETDSQHFPAPGMTLLYPSVGNYIVLVGRLAESKLAGRVKPLMQASTALPVYSANLPALVPGIDFSDHRNYWKFGFPALMVTDTAFQRNPNYHKSTDTPDTLDYARLAQVVQGVYGVATGL
jgi:hypothetical protein